MRVAVVVVTVIAAMLVTVGRVSAQEASVGAPFTTEVIACPDAVVNGGAFNAKPEAVAALGLHEEVEGETYECGVVYVPENYDDPDGRILELFYLRLFSTSQAPAPDPVINLAGGPGQSGSWELYENTVVLSNMNKLRERRDVIGYDQRGTGFSNYLLCAPFLSTLGIVMDVTDDPEIAAMIEGVLADPIGAVGLTGMICPTIYKAGSDVDLTQYNSVVSAHDIQYLMEALGYTEGYNLYGSSYGTRLSQFAMRSTPDGIRSVIIDGVVSPSISNVAYSMSKISSPYVSLFNLCAADADCNAAYPDLPERFNALLEEVAANPIVLDPPIVVNPTYARHFDSVVTQIDPGFFQNLAIANNGSADGGLANVVPRMIAALEAGDIDFVRATLGAEEQQTKPGATEVTVPGRSMLQLDQPLFQLPLTALLTIAQQVTQAEATGLDMRWISTVLYDLEVRLLTNEDQDELVADLVAWSLLPTQGTDAQALIDFANERLSPASMQIANSIVGEMTRGDIRNTMWKIQDVAMRLGTPDDRHFSTVLQNVVNCAEDGSFATAEVAQALADAVAFPLLNGPAEFSELLIAQCAAFPGNLDASVIEPVESDIPALIFGEALDTNTPVEWSSVVSAALSNSYYVEWANMGHVSFGHDIHNACAGDIAAAFLDNPAREPNSSCAESDTYKLDFVLPE